MSTPDQRRDRARNAAAARWHPGKTPDQIDQEKIDAHIAKIDAAMRAGTMTAEQRDVIGRLFRYIDPEMA